MIVDSVHACIERKLKKKSKVINAPAEYLGVCRGARVKPNPYHVQYLSHEYYNSYTDVLFYNSIRPGKKPGDPVVTDVKAQIFYELKFLDPWNSSSICLVKCCDAGVKVISLTFDGRVNNMNAMTLLGCNIDEDINNKNLVPTSI
ncbi:unnamed protein product [Euphydryas editha]|uniref:Uncharacterized protein n=1 Tax=Euphydryas editha TaxID=104508 RepID=A0AAU9TQI4_EUPED|nr:unnamed protein product [Euphydryas editha]